MADFLTTNGTSKSLEDIIMDSQKELILVSPYLQLSEILLDRLKEASRRKVKIIIIYGKSKLNNKERSALQGLADLELYFSKNLHAKCYFNENTMIITSMNMYEYSEKTNREMGVLIDRQHDTTLFNKAQREVRSILEAATYDPVVKVRQTSTPDFQTPITHNKRSGFCIRCSNTIRLNPAAPYCRDCFSVWQQWSNTFYIENVCHICGDEGPSSMAAPICPECFKL